MKSSYTYEAEFFDYIERGSQRSAAAIVPIVARALAPQSVLDVGCGRGVWLSEWIKVGARDCVGVDGDYVDKESLAIPRESFVGWNLSETFDLGRSFDLVQSLETAEHVDARHADVFIDNLCRHGRIVMFSAAVPGQGGESHVNEQPLEYWRRKFQDRGYSAFDWLRPTIRGMAAIEPWYRYNVLLFATDDASRRLSVEAQTAKLGPGVPAPDVAPISWRARNACLRLLPNFLVHRLAIIKHRTFNLERHARDRLPLERR